MDYRKEFIFDVLNNKINPEDPKTRWIDIEKLYNYETTTGSKPGDRARIHYKWYKNVGSKVGEWAPGKKISDEDIAQDLEEQDLLDTEAQADDTGVIKHSYLQPSDAIIQSREWQEFLAFKASKAASRDFIPGTYVVIGCTHVPFHNVDFFDAVINLIKDVKPTGLVIAGDFMDMNSVSAHEVGKKPLDGVTLSWEYEMGNQALDLLDNAHNYETKHFIFGNHEDRFWRHAQKTDIAKLGTALINPTVALDLHNRGYQVQESWKEAIVYLGKHLEVIHGDSCAQFSTKKHMDAFRTSMCYFHTHRVQLYMEGDTAAYNLGWGGDINSPAFGYATKTMKASWKNGFGVVTIDDLGGYHVSPIVWHNDRFYYGGVKYTK
jgi:Calcineurin-like phosphoesterase